jgi:hypothetical protein
MQHPTSSATVVIPKGTVLKSWEPYVVVPFWKGGIRDDTILAKALPRYQPCSILSRLPEAKCLPTKELELYVKKLHRDQSFEALVMLTVIRLVLDGPADRYEVLDGDVPRASPTSFGSDDTLLMEGWPMVQESISWVACSNLYHFVCTNLHEITLPHPLTTYTKDILLDLSPDEFDRAVNGALRHKMIPALTCNRLRMSQYLLDYVASVPTRRVGVLQYDPISRTTTINRPHNDDDGYLQQSCLPSVALELVATGSSEIQCHVIALYDSTSTESMTISSRPPPLSCDCPRCTYNRDPLQYCASVVEVPLSSSLSARYVKEAQRLAHVLFQEHNYDEAKKLYRICYESPDIPDRNQRAELWHAMGAVDLTRHKFIQAQRHWKENSHFSDVHAGIALQLEKQQVYEYLKPLPKTSLDQATKFEYDTLSPNCLFLSPSMIPKETCQQLIQWAEEYGTNEEGGWTTTRHYAVPTNDVPVHKVPKLLEWFQHWMNSDCQSLLREQYQTNQRFYVHDAFLVRYAASSTSRFLPLHYDESTHSMVLSLNDDFEGGGTYVFNVDSTICPSTGSLVTFRGDKMLHGGNPVTRGIRYILAVFMYLDDDDDDACRGKELPGRPWSDKLPQNKRPKTTSSGGGGGLSSGGGGGFSFDFF